MEGGEKERKIPPPRVNEGFSVLESLISLLATFRGCTALGLSVADVLMLSDSYLCSHTSALKGQITGRLHLWVFLSIFLYQL